MPRRVELVEGAGGIRSEADVKLRRILEVSIQWSGLIADFFCDLFNLVRAKASIPRQR